MIFFLSLRPFWTPTETLFLFRCGSIVGALSQSLNLQFLVSKAFRINKEKQSKKFCRVTILKLMTTGKITISTTMCTSTSISIGYSNVFAIISVYRKLSIFYIVRSVSKISEEHHWINSTLVAKLHRNRKFFPPFIHFLPFISVQFRMK